MTKWLVAIFIVIDLFFAPHNLFINNGQEVMFFGGKDVFAESTGVNIRFEGNSRRIRQKEPVKNFSHIWDGRKVHLSAAKNEYEPFQIILSSEHDVSNIRIEISDLISGDNLITRDNFKFYKVHYVSARDYGMIADPLVPLKGPVDLIAGINLPVWIRLYIPSDTRGGVYTGEITVDINGNKKAVPLRLHVWDFMLPEVSALFRVSPHWESSSFVKETYGKPANYIDLVYSFYRELKRMGISPAQSFDLKKVGTAGFSEGEDGIIEIDFTRTDTHIAYLLNELKYNYLDVEFFYSPVGKGDPNRSYPFKSTYINRVTGYLSVIADHYSEKGWLPQMWIQHYGDEPCQTCEGGEHLHPGYKAVREWSGLFRSAAPDLKILLSEHPTPQLVGAVDIWNAPWHLLKRGDVRERHEAGEKVIAYSCDTKLSFPLLKERINLWNLFSEEADGCWSWHLYSMGDLHSDDDNRRYSVFYNGKTIDITDEPIVSLRSEMMGEGKDDWEYLKLIEERFGGNMASSIANVIAKRPGPLGRGNVDEEGLYTIRDFIGRKMERSIPEFQDNFIDLSRISEIENLKVSTMYDGFIQLDYLEPAVLIEGFERLDSWKTKGPVRAALNFDKKTQGNSSVKVVFNKGTTNPPRFSFSSANLSVTNWSEYNYLEFDIYAEPPLSLFDLSVTFNDEYGSGYNVKGSVDWEKGDQVHAIGIFSQNGSFPGKWRHVKIDFDNLSGKLGIPSGRKNVTSINFRMGSGGTVNEPLPDTDYVVYIDNMRLQKRRYKSSGKFVSRPVSYGERINGFEWIGDYTLPDGTGLQFESRSGTTKKYDPSTWREWKPIEILSLFEGKFRSVPNPYVQYKVLFTSDGSNTPILRGVTIY